MWKQKLRIYKIERKERRYLHKYAKKKDPWIEQKFAQKVPDQESNQRRIRHGR